VAKSVSENKNDKRDIRELEQRLFNTHTPYSIIALANLITLNTSKNTLAGHKLSVNEWRILRLAFLYQPISAIDVINLFGLDKTTTGRAITKLRDAKLIRLTVNTLDRRQTYFQLTSSGKRLHDKIIKQDNVTDKLIEKVLTKNEIQSFHVTMNKLRSHVKEMLNQEN
jgi:DNA-binding MarR family transcriptional regulator